MSSRRRPATVPAKQVSLADFMRSKQREGCDVCKLPKEIRAQLGRAATKKGYTQEDQVDWLRILGHKIDIETLRKHVSGHHDRGEDFNAGA